MDPVIEQNVKYCDFMRWICAHKIQFFFKINIGNPEVLKRHQSILSSHFLRDK
jgi:hypothetical protein